MEYKSKWGIVENVELKINSYRNNGSLFMELWDTGGEYPEAYGNITVNLDNEIPAYCAYVDTNNMPEMEEFIRENKLGVFTGLTKESGFCEYPLYLFDSDKLRELCPKGLAEYEKAKGIEPEKDEQEKEETERSR